MMRVNYQVVDISVHYTTIVAQESMSEANDGTRVAEWTERYRPPRMSRTLSWRSHLALLPGCCDLGEPELAPRAGDPQDPAALAMAVNCGWLPGGVRPAHGCILSVRLRLTGRGGGNGRRDTCSAVRRGCGC